MSLHLRFLLNVSQNPYNRRFQIMCAVGTNREFCAYNLYERQSLAHCCFALVVRLCAIYLNTMGAAYPASRNILQHTFIGSWTRFFVSPNQKILFPCVQSFSSHPVLWLS